MKTPVAGYRGNQETGYAPVSGKISLQDVRGHSAFRLLPASFPFSSLPGVFINSNIRMAPELLPGRRIGHLHINI